VVGLVLGFAAGWILYDVAMPPLTAAFGG
jgi:hypothetical protein